jgi:hypothetical protein
MLDDDFPIDPDTENKTMVNGLLGIAATTRMLGEMRRGLLHEGFDDEEAFGLCEAYLINALCDVRDEEDD